MIKEFFLSAGERSKPLGIILKVKRKFLEDECFSLGASISFFAAFSLFPLLVVVISLFTFLLAAGFPLVVNFKVELIQAISNFNPRTAEFLEKSIEIAIETRKVAGATGLILLFLGGAGFFEQVTLALDKIWGVPHERSFLKRKFISWLIFLILIVLIFFFNLAELIVRSAISRFFNVTGYPWLSWVHIFSYLVFAFLLFTLSFKFLPASKVSLKSAVLGGLFTTFSAFFLNWLFTVYIKSVNLISLYGPIGVMILFLLWIYLFCLSLLLGGEVSSVVK